LDDEPRDDAVEDHVVVEALLGEVDEVLGRLRGALGVQIDLDVAELGADRRVGHGWFLLDVGRAIYGLTVTFVMTTGFVGFSASAAAAIASTTSIPLVTLPTI